MRFEDWVLQQCAEDQVIFRRLIEHNMSLIEGHNGNMVVTKAFLSQDNWNESKYHFSSVEFENYLVDNSIQRADYPLVRNSPTNRWTTMPFKRK